MTQIIDEDLLIELRQPGIESPVRQLYANYFENIVSHVCLNGGNREDGADIFQEAVLVLTTKVKTGQFRGESSVKTFLSSIARNLWLHELRTRQRRSTREKSYMNTEDKHEEQKHPFLDGVRDKALQQILGEIGDGCKRILTGFYYENKNMKQLLSEFNYENEQVLRNRKSKCMKKLKELIAKNTSLLQYLKTLSVYEQ